MDRSPLYRLFSWLWPVSEERVEGHFGPLEVRWENGRRVLNSAGANQSFGSLHRVWQGVLPQVVKGDRLPASVLMLGFGGGSALQVLRQELGVKAPVTAIEIDPVVLGLAERYFGSSSDAGLQVLTGDATILLHGLRERYDLILVDLFDDLDLARGVDTNGFAHALRDRCAEDGVVCFNTVAYDERASVRCQRVHDHLAKAFLTVEERVFEGQNRLFIAR
jgi:spermidine synthase